MHTLTHTHAHTHTHTYSLTHSHTPTHTNVRTLTYTHTHRGHNTHTNSHALRFSWNGTQREIYTCPLLFILHITYLTYNFSTYAYLQIIAFYMHLLEQKMTILYYKRPTQITQELLGEATALYIICPCNKRYLTAWKSHIREKKNH